MKIISTAFLSIILSTVALAQKETILKTIHDDGKTMQVILTVALPNVAVNFDKKYDVRNMTKEQKNKLVDAVIDSLGVTKYFKSDVTSTEHKQMKKEAGAEDRQAVERAILNYVEAFYEADTTKALESVAPYLSKRGYYTQNGEAREATMSFSQLVSLAKRWKSSQEITSSTPKKVTIFEVLDKTATAKVEAKWGIDYFHLGKINGKWTIVNVLWQEYPSKN
jgi:hypothetical protein